MPGRLKQAFLGASKPLLKAIATSNLGSRFVHRPLARCVAYMNRFHNDMRFPKEVLEEESQLERDLSKDLTVRRGPFAGTKYPSLARLGSACLPKLLGVYERELTPILDKIKDRPYTDILNVGCAEGYYAVGFARRHPNAKVTAYDIEPKQREFCASLAELNGVRSRVDIQSACSPEVLAKFKFSGRGLIICDCEGYEADLFTPAAVANLGNCDVLVEMHDVIDLTITDKVLNVFKPTHDVTLITSIDIIKRAKTFDVPELANLHLETRRRVLTERYAEQEWAFFEPRHG
jgi:SAM-dependent methyltransferase